MPICQLRHSDDDFNYWLSKGLAPPHNCTAMDVKHRPAILIIRDGWGENHNPAHDAFNAVKLAATPVSDQIRLRFPRTEILTCGRDVGLPAGIMGNSEVGHQNIGAGRVVDQEIVRIDQAFSSGSIASHPVLRKAFQNASLPGRGLHLMGLVSDAGVHSMLEHLFGLLDLASEAGLRRVFIHAITDGRDTAPSRGLHYIRQVERHCRINGTGRIATVIGRYWAMDRDKRWDRIEKAYRCLTGRSPEARAGSAEAAVKHYYGNPLDPSRKGDEFIIPTRIEDAEGCPVATVSDHDSVIFFNFRGDRPRQLTRAFIDKSFNAFERGPRLDLFYVCMTEYEKGLCPNLLFPKPPKMDDNLGGYVSRLGISQFRCAETEKYPHITFFFNDYRDEPFAGETQHLVPSPKDVPTYDLKPEMSAREICASARQAILSQQYGLIVVNFANPDMVGHTGSLEAAKVACETVDQCLGELLAAADASGAATLITADHGNADQMWEPDRNGPHTAHTLNPVEVIVAGSGCEHYALRDGGRLADIAPTLLRMMGLDAPPSMTGESLVQSE